MANGFDLELQDRGGLGHDKLMAARNQLLGMAMQDPRLVAVRPNGQNDTPEFKLDIDDARAGAQGVAIGDINSVLSTAWGSTYVNDFIQDGRVKKVYVQADPRFRMLPEDINRWYVRNNQGEMVPFSAFSTAHWQYGSPRLERYNGIPSVEIMGQAAPGISTGEAMNVDGEAWSPSCRPASATSGPASPTRRRRPAPRPRPSTPSRCWWSSSPWRPSTRA